MAIMEMETPQHPEVYEQKMSLPAPSEIDVGLPIVNNDATPDSCSSNADNSLLGESPIVAEVNEAAFRNQNAIDVTSSTDLPISQPLADSNQNSSQPLPDTNTTTSSLLISGTPDTESAPSLLFADATKTEPAPAIESATEVVISLALEDTAPTSIVPPHIEAQESDLRDTTSLLALPTNAQLEPPQPTHLETEPDHLRNMDGAVDAPDAQHVMSNGFANLNSLPLDAHLADPAPLQDEQPAVNQDEVMTDAPVPAPFTKISREREDDIDDEPSAKRTKTEEDSTKVEGIAAKAEDDTAMADTPAQESQAVSEAPVAPEESALPEVPSGIVVPVAAKDEEAAPVKSEDASPITPYQMKEITKILKTIVRNKAGMNFKGPVKELWPSIAEGYAAKVSHPVDLATMEKNLKDQKYPTLNDFKAEVNLIYANTLAFNGEAHEVTAAGKLVRDTILTKLETIPAEPAVVPKAAKKQRKSTPLSEPAHPRASAPRQQSKSGGAAPVAGAAATTFALDPNTSTPLIRRDSTKVEGGRPKREIHPPKHKDLIYNNAPRHKNKKVAQELKFCEEILAEMKKPKHAAFADPFKIPVDPVSLNIPNYFSVIKHPMDLSTIEGRIKSGEYSGTKDFERDMKLMFANCYKYNPASNVVHQWGKQLEAVYNEAWAKKSQWIADHAPAESPSSNGGSDEEESEEEIEVEEPKTDAIAALSERLTEEQDKLIALMSSNPKKNAQMIEMQEDMIKMLKDKIAATKAKASTTKKVVKKAKPVKPAKKQAPAKKAGTGAPKRPGKRQKYLGTIEKNTISMGIGNLPDEITQIILAMIKAETVIDDNHDGEVELDIDVVSPESLWKIYDYVMQYSPGSADDARAMLDDQDGEPPAKSAKPPTKKKNKPMSKSEQERKISQLDNTIDAFGRHASGSQEPIPTVEPQDQSTPAEESSGDDSDSEED